MLKTLWILVTFFSPPGTAEDKGVGPFYQVFKSSTEAISACESDHHYSSKWRYEIYQVKAERKYMFTTETKFIPEPK